MAGTVLIGVLVGLAAGSVLRRDGGRSTVVTLPPIAAATPAAVAPDLIERADDPVPISADQSPPLLIEPSSAVAPVAPRLYSEADLMAVLPEEEMRAAVMRAEWFVTDFFTVDGASSAESDVTAALATPPDEVPLPHATATDGISYVEWARAFFVEPVEPGIYRVSVAFRTLLTCLVRECAQWPFRCALALAEPRSSPICPLRSARRPLCWQSRSRSPRQRLPTTFWLRHSPLP